MNVANERIQPLLYTRHKMVQLESDELYVSFGLRIVFVTICVAAWLEISQLYGPLS